MKARELIVLTAVAGLLVIGVIKVYRSAESQHAAALIEQAPRDDGLTWKQHVVGEVELEVMRKCGADRNCWSDKLPAAVADRAPNGSTAEQREQIESYVLVKAGITGSKT